MVDREVLPALTIQLVVRAPAVCDDCGLLVDVTFDDVQQCFSVTLIVWTHSQKDVPSFSTNSAYNPLPSTNLPLLYFRFPNLLSSISTVRPVPPINFGVSLAIVFLLGNSSTSLRLSLYRPIVLEVGFGRTMLFYYRTSSPEATAAMTNGSVQKMVLDVLTRN